MARRSKVVFCLLLAFLYVVVNICPLRAEALPDVMSGSTTLADNIMTYYALSGSAVANTDWINTLYSSYGSSFGTIEELANQGYLVLNDAGMWEPVQELTQMIEQAPAYSSLGLNEIFNVSAEEAAAGGGYAAASGASILAGSLGGVASTGVVTLLGAVSAAYWGGIAIGTLAYHIIDKYSGNIELSAPINYPVTSNLLQKRYPGGNVGSYMTANTVKFMFVPSEVVLYGYSRSPTGYFQYSYINNSNQSLTYRRSDIDGTFSLNRYGNFDAGNTDHETYVWPNMFSDPTSRDNFRDGVLNGTVTPEKFQNYSPDIIGPNGNQTPEYDSENQEYTIPDIKPQIDPGTQAGKPLTLQDWQNFANAVQNNNNNTAPTGSPDNASLFDNILDLIRTVIPDNVPDPNPNPDPYSPPVVTPVPDPSYPDPVPDQQITENPQESENPQQTENPIDTGKPWRLPDLRNKFPF